MSQQILTVFCIIVMLKATANPPPPYTGRECKDFILRVFKHYGLPTIPANRSFPHSPNGKLDLTKFNQGKPEFTIETTPISIDKGVGVPGTGHLPHALRMSDPKLNPYPFKKRVRFKGQILKNGNYELLITEMSHQSVSASSISNRLEESQPITHKFRFSNQCSFQKYQVHQPRSPMEFEDDYGDGYKRGFNLSSDKKCVFDEIKNESKRRSYIRVMSQNGLRYDGEKNLERKNERAEIMMKEEKNVATFTLHPYYYWNVCGLAKSTMKTSHDSNHDEVETVDQ